MHGSKENRRVTSESVYFSEHNSMPPTSPRLRVMLPKPDEITVGDLYCCANMDFFVLRSSIKWYLNRNRSVFSTPISTKNLSTFCLDRYHWRSLFKQNTRKLVITWTSNFRALSGFEHQFLSIERARAANLWIFQASSELENQNF